MHDLVTRLRTWVHAVDAAPVSDLMDEAAAEIERLRNGAVGSRETVQLTDEEREAVEYFSKWCIGPSERLTRHGATLRALLERNGGCTPQLDCGADRTSVASTLCRDTGGQPFDSAPITTLTDAEREAISRDLSWLHWCEENNQIGDVGRRDIDTLRGLLERLG